MTHHAINSLVQCNRTETLKFLKGLLDALVLIDKSLSSTFSVARTERGIDFKIRIIARTDATDYEGSSFNGEDTRHFPPDITKLAPSQTVSSEQFTNTAVLSSLSRLIIFLKEDKQFEENQITSQFVITREENHIHYQLTIFLKMSFPDTYAPGGPQIMEKEIVRA